jgi:hypothetical protein
MPFDHTAFTYNNLTVSFTGQHKRLISSPPVAVFPHPLASDLSFSRYANFALESYAAYLRAVKERVNHTSPIHSVTMTVSICEASLVGSRWGPKRAPNISFFTLNCWDISLNIFSVKNHDG